MAALAQQITKKIIKKEKKTTIIVTHDIGEAISIADRVIVLSKRPSVIKDIIDIDISVDGVVLMDNNDLMTYEDIYLQISLWTMAY